MDRLERLVNLVAALIDTSHPLTRSEIRERIEGYSDDPDAFRRNFERDKDLLRQMGFPLVTVAIDPTQPDDLGYRIPRELYELPDPRLDEAELAALRLAAGAVQLDNEWAQEAVIRALRKLGGGVDGTDPVTHPTRVAALPGEETAAVAFGAVAERRQVSFSYRGERRLVDPWRLSFHRGHWYMSGMDHVRGEERLFRLDRVEGQMIPEGPPQAFERPSASEAAPPHPWRLGEEDEVTARVRVDSGQAHWAVTEAGDDASVTNLADGSVEIEISVTNRAAFRSFVIGYLDHAEVIGPPELRGDMISWLEGLTVQGSRP